MKLKQTQILSLHRTSLSEQLVRTSRKRIEKCWIRNMLTSSSFLLRWPYSPACVLASFTIRLQASRSLALSHHSFIPIFLRSVDTSSNHLIFGLPLRLVAYSFPYIFFQNCGVLHSFYMTKPYYSLAFYKPDSVLLLNYSF